ncbi:MAG: UvrD-helicase domain-containing protein, partial [Casimicrobiaceae bacterium]
MSSERETVDDAARAQALDITRSWLVQAPAGSGKTGLLIQRFLALLAIVDRPERIVAMTFTRKAAAEMRERILRSLREAGDGGPPPEPGQHALLTRHLAVAARKRIDAAGWDVFDQPARLRIMTIDALAASLVRQAPVSSRLGAMPRVDERAQTLYDEAVRVCLASAPASDSAWQRFLDWLDNDVEQASRLLTRMLAGRDRWPARFLEQDTDALRKAVEAALGDIGERAASEVAARLPPALIVPFAESAGNAAVALEREPTDSVSAELREALVVVARARMLPPPGDRSAWRALSDWLLAKDGGFRKKIDKRQGFAAKGSGSGAAERAHSKAAFVALLADAAAVPGLELALQQVRDAPPATFDDTAWNFVAAAMTVLGRSADELEKVFAQRGAIDFPEQTFRALAALGDVDAPGELLLAIDYLLSHLLVDEFQDTSAAQLALIARLTAGWEPGDGRTLFVVGDPVQSIYRFRKAEVGLFVAAQARAEAASVPVGTVALTRNFRSAAPIVEWVNTVFGHALPAQPDASRGEVAYAPAHAAATLEGEAPSIDFAASRADEVQIVVARIRDALAAGHGSVAVLLRARTHASALLPELRRAGIDYSAVELEAVHDRLATRDLLTLARALSQPADRLAWFSVLRAPWCGLSLADLLALGEAVPADGAPDALIDAVEDPARIPALSQDGGLRLLRVADALRPILVMRGTSSFGLRLRAAWMALGGPAGTESGLDLDGAERVFALIDRHARGGDLDDYDDLTAEAETLFAQSAEPGPGTVQVMTLHRAKGLEFDTVVIPGLDRTTRGGAAPLLRWGSVGDAAERTLIVAPRQRQAGATREQHPVYAWLAGEDAREERAELARLIYVGVTRAKRRLHLVGVVDAIVVEKGSSGMAWKRPGAGSALARIWDSLERGALLPAPVARTNPAPERAAAPDPLRRIALDWQRPPLPVVLPAPTMPETIGDRVTYDWAETLAVAVGTVAHRLFAQIGHEGLARWDDARLRGERSRLVAELAAEGIEADQRDRAARQVAMVIARTLSDARGRWIFSPEHTEAHSEWALSGVDDGRIVHVVLDRSFVSRGERYIVDFKTGRHEGGDRPAFLAHELDRYRPQLLRYARIVRALDSRPIRIALYHPLVDYGWHEEAPV